MIDAVRMLAANDLDIPVPPMIWLRAATPPENRQRKARGLNAGCPLTVDSLNIGAPDFAGLFLTEDNVVAVRSDLGLNALEAASIVAHEVRHARWWRTRSGGLPARHRAPGTMAYLHDRIWSLNYGVGFTPIRRP